MLSSRHFLALLAVTLILTGAATQALADTVTIDIYPNQVPDETEPRPNLGDAPTGFGPHSWQGPATGKSNWHARYLADGDSLSDLFPADAATMSVDDIASISYWTNRPSGTPSSRDWWIQIYTRPDGTDDAASWYGYRFINNYNDHTAIDTWTQYSTASGMTFNRNDEILGAPTGVELGLAGLKTTYGSELVEMFSVQTDSGWNGFDGYMDGLEITLTNGNIGRVNFTAVPLPGAAGLGLVGLLGLGFVGRIRRRRRMA